jgi:3-hydroxyisobutyrate dehydrogenase-like beta-hydroxyacid dehydrogenase
MQPLLDAGARGASSPAEVASASEVVISMVPDAPDVREVMLGAQGVAKGARRVWWPWT